MDGVANLAYKPDSISEGLNHIDGSRNDAPIHGDAMHIESQEKVPAHQSNLNIIQRCIDGVFGPRNDSVSCSLKSLTWVGEDQIPSDLKATGDNGDQSRNGSLRINRVFTDSTPLTMALSKSFYLEPRSDIGILSSIISGNCSPGITSRLHTNSSESSEGEASAWKKKFVLWLSKYAFVYPLICLSMWALLYIWCGQLAFPGGPLFGLIVLEVTAISLGLLAEFLGLPPLLGMIVAGLILRNVPYINVAKDLTRPISNPLRGMSVVVLLTRGGFSVNPSNIKKFRNVVPSLAVGSCVLEAICGSVAVYFIIGFPPAWSALMGCIMSAMSGSLTTPYLLEIEKSVTERDCNNCNQNVKDAIIIAKTACGLDAILAICMAEFCLGFIFGSGVIDAGFTKGPAEVVMGGVFGALWGGTAGLLLDNTYQNSTLRAFVVFAGGVMSLLGLFKIGYPRGGPLGCFLGSLVVISIWRHRKIQGLDEVYQTFDKLWFFFQPLLFGILGARTDFSIVDWGLIGQGVICLAISVVGRLCASFLMTSWSKLPFRERLFLVISWMPKGTVQAALGPVALETAAELGLDESYHALAYKIMNLAATTIILSSVLGTLMLKFVGPQILKKC